MDFQSLDILRKNHPAWKLLTADNAVLVTSFLYRSYIKPNVRTLAESQLKSRLDDYLFHLNRELSEGTFPRSSGGYIEDWASDKCAWLRKYYVPGNDEPHLDITPATEQAIDWLSSLNQRAFIGTESRLLTVFELLRQLAEGTETDPKARIQSG